MRQSYILVGLVCFIAIILPACSPAPQPEAAPEPVFDQAAEEAALRAAEEKFNAAWNAQDIGAILATNDECAESWDGTISSLETAEKAFEAAFAGPYKNLRSTILDEIGVVFVTPEVAIYKCIYEWAGILDEAGNEIPATKNLYARVYVKRNGGWLGCGYFARPIEE